MMRSLIGLSMMVMLALAGPTLAAPAVTLYAEGEPQATIYIAGPVQTPPDTIDRRHFETGSSTPERDAIVRGETIAELQEHLTLMAGKPLPVVVTDDASAIETPAIVLGKLAEQRGLKVASESPAMDGFALEVRDGMVLIAGESEDGVLFGAYELLEQLGCDWVMPGEIGQIVPKRSTVTLEAMKVAEAPDFPIRRLWYRGARSKEFPPKPDERVRMSEWLRRMRMGVWEHPVAQTAGHAWTSFTRRHKEAFEKDPTMWALRLDPKTRKLARLGPQIETTHPRVIELFAQDIIETYEKNIAAGKWTAETAAGFPIGPADGLGYSVSEASKAASSGAIEPTVGDPDTTDLLILMANQILEIVHEKYPNAYVGYYTYSTHAAFPQRYTPNPKIGQIFAPINYSRFHSVVDENSESQQLYRPVVEAWSELSRKQGNPLMFRGYNWNLAENLMPFTKVRIWGEEIPFYKEHGFLGHNVEATRQWSTLGASNYIFMRLAWDADADWKELLRHYTAKAYGKGGDAMYRYELNLANRQSEAGQEAGSYHSFPLMYDEEYVKQARGLLEEALSAADTPEDKERVLYVMASHRALELYLDYYAATLAFDFQAAAEGYEAIRQHWRDSHARNDDIMSVEGYEYLVRFLWSFVSEAKKYSEAPYRMVHRLPDELPTHFDPQADSERQRSQIDPPPADDDAWQTTRTISTTWDDQGLSRPEPGRPTWYRHTFTLPEDVADDQAVGLFLGGFNDEARVWLNGQYIGTSGRRFSKPAAYDLTDALKRDGQNVLHIHIVRNSAANELGVGGLMRPSFLFTGPQLETRAPIPGETRRVLPGGELGGVE